MPEIHQKWGFGNAPLKQKHETEYRAAIETVRDFILSGSVQELSILEKHISLVKGLFNRIARQDQWDWSTVSHMMGHPPVKATRHIGFLCDRLRRGLLQQDIDAVKAAREGLKLQRAVTYMSTFLGLIKEQIGDGDGFIYILSTRELPDLLKIGVTTRSVEERVKEINSATGVAIPFGVRKVWPVDNAKTTERLLHDQLAEYRVRRDREFFRIEFVTATTLISEILRKSGLMRRQRGVISKLLIERGFGFIVDESQSQYFFSAKSCTDISFEALRVGMLVNFSRRDGDKGPIAYDLSRRQAPSS